jgi:hypothetical protein
MNRVEQNSNEVKNSYKLNLEFSQSDLFYVLQQNEEEENFKLKRHLKKVEYNPNTEKFIFESDIKREKSFSEIGEFE